jgi:hypothetical protein
MATKRPSFEKRQRDQAKRAKAAAKREKRHNKGDEELEGEEEEATAVATNDPLAHLSEQDIIERLDALHKRFDDEQISFDAFEEQRDALLARLQA